MRRGRRGKKDDAQSSLDAFSNASSAAKEAEPRKEPIVPSMPDLDALARADEILKEQQEAAEQVDFNKESPSPLRTFRMPSMDSVRQPTTPAAEVIYHDLGGMYPHPPISNTETGLVLHRAVLNDITGCSQLMDWVADDHAVIVDMNRLMKKTIEFNSALAQLNAFIDEDLGGQIIQMTESRLMLLPPGCRGVRGVEMEAFAVDSEELGRRRI